MRDQLGRRRLSEHWHAFCWIVVVAAAAAAYVFAHYRLQDRYIMDISPQVEDAVQLYGVRWHHRTGVLEFHVGATAYEPDSEAPGPLAIGKLPQARGVLNEAFNVVEEYNSGVRAYVEGLRHGFFRSPHNPYFMATIVRPLELQSSDDEDCKPQTEGENCKPQMEGEDCKPQEKGGEVQFRFRVSADKFMRILEKFPNEETLDAFIDLMDDAEPVCVVGGKGAKRWYKGEDTLAVSVSEMCKRREDLRASVTDQFGPIGFSSVANCESSPGLACGPCERAEQHLRGAPKGNDDGDPEVEPSDTAGENKFHDKLADVVEENAGFFWTSGRFFWIEILSLAALGVLTRQLVVFAKAYAAGRGRALVWRPSESLRTLMYLAVAPIFTLVVIWILSATDLVPVKPVIGEDWSNITVPIAFLLGLFPTLGYDVLRGLAKGLFNRPLKDDDRRKAKPEEIQSTPIDDPGTPPSVLRLRRRIRDHATAVFR